MWGHEGLQWVTRGNKGDNMGYTGFDGTIHGYEGLQGVAQGYKAEIRGYKRLHEVRCCETTAKPV